MPPPNYPDWIFPTSVLRNRISPHRCIWVRAILAEVSGSMSVQVFEASSMSPFTIRRILMTASLGVIMLTCEPHIVVGEPMFVPNPRSSPPDLLDENGTAYQPPGFEDWLAGRHFGPAYAGSPGDEPFHDRLYAELGYNVQELPPSQLPAHLDAEQTQMLEESLFRPSELMAALDAQVRSLTPEQIHKLEEAMAEHPEPMTFLDRLMLDDELG